RLKLEHVFAAGFFVGTPTGAKHAPMAESSKIPIVGLFTGAQLLHEPFKRYVVNVRASYYDEAREQVDNLWNALGMRKIAVFYQDDAFGVAVLEGVKLALAKYNAAPVALGSFPPNARRHPDRRPLSEGAQEILPRGPAELRQPRGLRRRGGLGRGAQARGPRPHARAARGRDRIHPGPGHRTRSPAQAQLRSPQSQG